MNERVKELMNERKIDMKRIVMIIMAVALVALPTMAQQDQWQSTSAMKGSGSVYAPQVTGVGAAGVDNLASTTTETYSPANASSGPRKTLGHGTDAGSQSEEFPIGDAVLPLLFLSLAFCGVIYLRRRKALSR